VVIAALLATCASGCETGEGQAMWSLKGYFAALAQHRWKAACNDLTPTAVQRVTVAYGQPCPAALRSMPLKFHALDLARVLEPTVTGRQATVHVLLYGDNPNSPRRAVLQLDHGRWLVTDAYAINSAPIESGVAALPKATNEPSSCYQVSARKQLGSTALVGPPGMLLAGNNTADFSGTTPYGCNQRDIRFDGVPVAITGEDQFLIDIHLSFYPNQRTITSIEQLNFEAQAGTIVAGTEIWLFDGHGESAGRFILGGALVNLTYACAGSSAQIVECEAPLPLPSLLRSNVEAAAAVLIPQLRRVLGPPGLLAPPSPHKRAKR
jgi:hypothetical protein